MSVSVYYVFVLSCVGSGLAIGLITRPRSPVYKDPYYQINFDGNGPEGVIRKTEDTRRCVSNQAAATCFTLVWFLAWLILRPWKMVTTCSSDKSVDFQWLTRRYVPEDRTRLVR
jgi:hypothetical protein